MSVKDFENITPRELINKIAGYEKIIEKDYQLRWEIARWQAIQIIAPPQKRQISAFDLIKFPWETAPVKSKKEQEQERKRAQEKALKWSKGSKPKAKM